MTTKVTALLIYNDCRPMRDLQRMLANQFIKVTRASTCHEAAEAIGKADPPHLVFTDAELPDGTWADVLNATAAAPAPVNVIVVVRTDEIKLYLEAIQRGAFDLMAPPFSDFDVAHVVKHAVSDVFSRRKLALRYASRSSQVVSAT